MKITYWVGGFFRIFDLKNVPNTNAVIALAKGKKRNLKIF